MPAFCSAFGCSNSSTKQMCRREGISFHKFPLADKKLLRRWLINVRRANFQPSPYSHLCSIHFTEEDFEYQSFTNRRGLKKDAVPTRFSYNSYKSGHKRNKSISHKNHNLETHEDIFAEPVNIQNNGESNKIQLDDPALVEIFMNEKFYPPEHLKAVKTSLKSKKTKHALHEKITALKEGLHSRILLRSLKKQFLDYEIKAANAKRDYYEAKQVMLEQTQDILDSEDSSDSETESPLKKIRTRLEEEELAAKVEEKVLKEQLKEAQMSAANSEKDYYEKWCSS